jgi:hypothetical protein
MSMRTTIMALLLLATPALAQPEAARAQLRERVRIATVQRLVQRLRLDPPTAARMSQIAKTIDDQIAAVQNDGAKVHRELRQLLDSGHADDASINRLTDHILGNRARIHQLEDNRTAEIRKILRPIDYGRLVLVWPQVNRQIRAEIYSAMGPNSPPPDEP